MSREILSKAKKTDNGEWVEGYYVCLNKNQHRIYTGYAETDCGDYYPDWYEVDPDTLCQYTGLPANWLAFENEPQECDVWEHDLLEVDYNGKKVIAEVKYEGGMFILGSNEFVDSYIPLFDVTQVEDDDYWVDAAVLGNIFDDSKLLEGDE